MRLIAFELLVALLVHSTVAAEKTAADYLPNSVVGVLVVPQPGKVLDVVIEHPLTAK